jgi:hypothetical protein
MLKNFTWGPVISKKYRAESALFASDTPQVFYSAYISEKIAVVNNLEIYIIKT